MDENDLIQYIGKTRTDLSEELYNFFGKQKEELFNYINTQDQDSADALYSFISDQKKEIFDYVNAQDNKISDASYDFVNTQKKEIFDYIRAQDKKLSNSLYDFIEKKNRENLKFLDEKFREIASKINLREDFTREFEYVSSFFDAHSSAEKKIIILGIPEHGNIGDHAIAMGEKIFCKKNFRNAPVLLLSWDMLHRYQNYLTGNISSSDLICITGGGFLGTIWPNEQEELNHALRMFRRNPVIVFPQSFWCDTENNESNQLMTDFESAMKSCDDLTVCLREKISFDRLKSRFPETAVLLIPDMAFWIQSKSTQNRTDTVLLCLRKDKEKILPQNYDIRSLAESLNFAVSETSTVTDETIPVGMSDLYVYDKLAEFAAAKLVITDRLHGLIFSVLTKTPCIAFDNLSGKVYGFHNSWLDTLPTVKLASDPEDVKKYMQNLYGQECSSVNLREFYDPLISLIKRKTEN